MCNRKHIQATGLPDKQAVTNPASNREYSTEDTKKSQLGRRSLPPQLMQKQFTLLQQQGIDFLLTEPEQPEAAVLLVSEADHSETAVPMQANAVPAPTLPPVAAAYLDHSDGEEDNQSHLSGSERGQCRGVTPDLLTSKLPVWCLQRHQNSVLVQSLTLVKKINTLVRKNTLVKKNNPEGAGDKGRKICYQPFAQMKSNKAEEPG